VKNIWQVECVLELVRDEGMRALKQVEIIYYDDELLKEIRTDQRSCREGVNLVFTLSEVYNI
jgi:hypothetical protein